MIKAEGPSTSRSRLPFVGLLTLLALPALAGEALTARLVGLGGAIDPTQAYFRADTFVSMHLLSPLVLLGALLVWVAPGLVIAGLRRSGPSEIEALVLEAVCWTVLVSLLLSLCGGLQAIVGGPPGLVVVMVAVLALVVHSFRLQSSGSVTTGVGGFLLWVVLPSLVLGGIAGPKIFWESTTGDGAHAFEATRLLLHGKTPFFTAAAGSMSSYPGPNSLLFSFVAAPFMTLLGEDIAAIRLVFFVSLGLLACALRALLPGDLRDRVGVNILMWLVLSSTGLALGWSAGYDPYGSDLSLPGAQDLLLMAMFVGAIAALIREERIAFVVLGFLAALSSPNGGLLLLLLVVARFLARGPSALRKSLELLALVMLALLLQALVGKLAHDWWGMEGGDEHGLRPLLRKLRFLDLGDWRRLLWLVPSGIFPLVVCFRMRTIKVEARCLALTGLLSFAFFFPLLKTNLHYFAPAMILPLAAYLAALREPPRRAEFLVCAGLGLVALLLCLPRTGAIVVAAQSVGESIDLSRLPGYEDVEARAFQPMAALALLLAADHDPGVPESRYGGSALAWNYHSRRATSAAEKCMTVLAAELVPPAGAQEVGRVDGYVAWVTNREAWVNMQSMKPRVTKGRSFLLASRDRMFGSRDLEQGTLVFDLRKALKFLGIGGR